MGHKRGKRVAYGLAGLMTFLLITGCTPLLLGGTATSASIADDHRSVGAVVNDAWIKLRAEALIAADKPLHRASHVDVTSVDGLVLLTGEAARIADRNKILTIVRGIEGVRRIVDQLRIAPPSSFGARLTDSWVTLRVKSALLADGLDANPIKVVTAHRVVYLLGLVPAAVGDKAARAASRIPHVRSIIELFETRS